MLIGRTTDRQPQPERTPPMKNSQKSLVAALALGTLAVVSAAVAGSTPNPMVGGKEMFPNKDIIDNAVNSADHTTLVAAVKAADLVTTLKGTGPFTVFAPTNAAFAKLPAGTVEGLLKPENKATLTKILTYHVVAGKVMAGDLVKMIQDGKGTTSFKTVAGASIQAMLVDGKVVLKDEKGLTSTVTIADVNQSNGVIHVVDSVLLPN